MSIQIGINRDQGIKYSRLLIQIDFHRDQGIRNLRLADIIHGRRFQ